MVFHCHMYYRRNSTFSNVLIKKMGIPTYHESSRVNTRDKVVPQVVKMSFLEWQYQDE